MAVAEANVIILHPAPQMSKPSKFDTVDESCGIPLGVGRTLNLKPEALNPKS